MGRESSASSLAERCLLGQLGQRGAHFRSHLERIESVQRVGREIREQAFGGRARAGALDEASQVFDLGLLEARPTPPAPHEEIPLRSRQGRNRLGIEDVALALAYVGVDGLPGAGAVAERAEEIVAELE